MAEQAYGSTPAQMTSLCEWVLGPTPFEEVCQVASEAGVTGVHIRGDRSPRDPGKIRAAADAAGVRVLGITPAILWPRDEADLSNPDPQVRARGIAYYRGVVDLAAELGVPTVEVVPACEGRLEPLRSTTEERSWAVASLQQIAEHASGRGVRLAVEPLNRYETYLVTRVEEAADMIARVGAEGMGVVADAFHMSIEESDPVAAVRAIGSLLAEVQLADSNRRAPGLGHLDLSGIVRAARDAGHRGPWVMEFLPRGAGPSGPSGPAEPPDLEAFRADLEAAARLVGEDVATGRLR
jgi:sugar phosphate isomerase/epimerase